jgi:hypothetical protein
MGEETPMSREYTHPVGKGLQVYLPGERRRHLVRWLLILSTGTLLFWYGWPWPLPFAEYYLASVQQVALADLNGDGHLDAYVAFGNGMPLRHYILFNDGPGKFNFSDQNWIKWWRSSVTLGDLTGNGVADVLLEGVGGGIAYFANDGQRLHRPYGPITPTGILAAPEPNGVTRFFPVLGDLNGNGYLDIFGAGCCGRVATTDGPLRDTHRLPNSLVWLNQGDGRLLPTNQRIGQVGSNGAALADLNGNGHLDVFLANGRTMNRDANYQTLTPNTVWFNDGRGHFSDSGQQLGAAESQAVALGDLTGNGFPDAVVGNQGPDEVWFNDGRGHFSDSGQRLGVGLTRFVFQADLNGNGHLDLFVAGQRGGQVWFNDGAGRFQPGSQRIRYYRWETAVLGDLNDNGYADILVVGPARYRVWRNNGDGHFRAGLYSRYR